MSGKSKKVLVHLDMGGNQLISAVIENIASTSVTSPVTGQMIYDGGAVKIYNGSQWVTLASGGAMPSPYAENPNMDGEASPGSNDAYSRGDHVHPTDTSRQSTANMSANMTDDTGSTTKYPSVNAVENYVAGKISGVYKYKGSVATESDLPSSGQETGDVYNIVDASTYGPAGTNVAWTGSAWDALGGTIDVSVFQTIGNKVTSWQSTPDNTHYPSEKLVKDSLDSYLPLSAGSTKPLTGDLYFSNGKKLVIMYPTRSAIELFADNIYSSNHLNIEVGGTGKNLIFKDGTNVFCTMNSSYITLGNISEPISIQANDRPTLSIAGTLKYMAYTSDIPKEYTATIDPSLDPSPWAVESDYYKATIDITSDIGTIPRSVELYDSNNNKVLTSMNVTQSGGNTYIYIYANSRPTETYYLKVIG